MIRKIHTAITKHHLFARGDHVLAAVSGGADSVCMLHVLHEQAPALGIRITVAHLDHRLRGAASLDDANFTARLAESLGLPFAGGSSDVRRRARRYGVSVEMAARRARYEFFSRTARKLGANKAATAHTADDQAETVVLKLARGAGPGGLGGIPRDTVLRGLRVVRPLLDVTRPEIEAFLRDRGLTWREDASNDDLFFLRNRVRHEILPMLESRLNPSVRRALVRAAELLTDEEGWLDAMTGAAMQRCVCRDPAGPALDAGELAELPVAARRRVIRRWLVSGGVAAEHMEFETIARVESLGHARRTGRSADIAGGWTVRNRYGRLVLVRGGRPEDGTGFRSAVRVPGETVLADAGLRITTLLETGVTKPRPSRVGVLPAGASIGRNAVGRRRIFIRSRRYGDRIKPLGLSGSKKVQDIFVDDKVPAEQRRGIPLFECGGELIWIPGYRVARGWEVTDPEKPSIQIRVERI